MYLMHPALVGFISHKEYPCKGPESTDRYGRFLLPMDEVLFQHPTDNPKVELSISGTVIDTHFIGGKWYTKVRTNPIFLELGFESERVCQSNLVCRLPVEGSLLRFILDQEVCSANRRISSMNAPITVNGNKIYA